MQYLVKALVFVNITSTFATLMNDEIILQFYITLFTGYQTSSYPSVGYAGASSYPQASYAQAGYASSYPQAGYSGASAYSQGGYALGSGGAMY